MGGASSCEREEDFVTPVPKSARRWLPRDSKKQGGKFMLFMAIFTYDPQDRDQVIQRRIKSPAAPKGVEVKGEWYDIAGHRVFRLFEADDVAHVAALFYSWTDLGFAELIPVLETEFAIKMLRKVARK
jgi:hypothetical protein